MKRKVFALLMVLMLLLGTLPTAYAADDDVTVILNGQELIFADQKPIIMEGRTMVPFRAIFEALGCSVEWDGELRAVYGTYTDGEFQRIISMFIDNPVVMYPDFVVGVNSMPIGENGLVLDVAPTIMNSRTLVPLRAVSEMLGSSVDWDGDTRTVTIVSGKPFELYQNVTDEEINTFVSENLLCFEEFVVTDDPNLKPAEMEALLTEILDQAKKGVPFETLANLYDEATGAETNFYASWQRTESGYEKIAVGEVGIVLLPDAYHIVKRVAPSLDDNRAKAAAIKYLTTK